MNNMTKKLNFTYVIPVLVSFFVMSFCDLVGIGVDRVKLDFGLSNTLVQLIPSAVFVWFFILSVPVGILQDRIGKRNMVNIGMGITAIGLFFPFLFLHPSLLFYLALHCWGSGIPLYRYPQTLYWLMSSPRTVHPVSLAFHSSSRP